MKLVYINNSKSSVFDSQVLALLKYYQKNAFFEEVILVFGYQNQEEIDWLRKKDTEGIIIYFYKSYPNYPFFNYLIQRNLFRILRTISINFIEYFFHIRGEMTSFHFKKIATKLEIEPKQLLTDVRGVSIQELNEFSNANRIIKWFKLYNYKKAFKSLISDKNISVVSDYFKTYLISLLKIAPESIFVNSCLVDNTFKFDALSSTKIRNELKLKDSETLMIFASGGTAAWQNNDIIIKLANTGIKVLNLSRLEIKNKNVINKFVPYSEVPKYLSAADISFIWRDNSLVNKVASPVKISEYMACGLPIVHNGTVDLINTVTTDGIDALLINDIDDLNLVKVKNIVKEVNREELSKKGQLLFGISSIAESYKNIYRQKSE